eukprot:Gb_20638 [translate_table: standard]
MSCNPCSVAQSSLFGCLPLPLLLRKPSQRTNLSPIFINAQTSADDKPCSKAVYIPTPACRDLRTPHSGYHFDGSRRRFFEGWYFRVSIPEQKQSFCFMYSAEDPAFSQRPGELEEIFIGPRFPGIGAQILGADDKYICQYSQEVNCFWGSRHELALGNAFVLKQGALPPKRETIPQEFWRSVEEGFQATPVWHQGFICDDGRSTYVQTVKTARWEYSTKPVYGWGDVGSKQRATAGWMAALPVFEPHWQICMAGGLSTGWIEWDDQRFEFKDAPSYSEKNWGGAFPQKWFWVQCNVFEGVAGEVALTAGGGRRQLPSFSNTYEDVAMVGVHYDGKFYEFVPWVGLVEWEISKWGYWRITAENDLYEVELEATTKSEGTILRAPTTEAGLVPYCKDTCLGNLKLQIWERTKNGQRGKIILDVTSDMAALEVGGGPWYSTWRKQSSTPVILRQVLGFPLDVEEVFNPAPILKPPGL